MKEYLKHNNGAATCKSKIIVKSILMITRAIFPIKYRDIMNMLGSGTPLNSYSHILTEQTTHLNR